MVRKLFIFSNLLLVLFFVNGDTSVWEGASSSDMYGKLPDRGFYVSTSFFPRNTVVDVTSLETGKTIQVIVADNVSSPGNGVILSRDAAEALGMGIRSSMRIRVNPPPDTAAFSRFSDGRSFSGDPDYDPRAFIRANALPVETQALNVPPSGSPPSVSVISDSVLSDPSELSMADTSQFELPNTVTPLIAPSGPVMIFMPAPIPTETIVNEPSDIATNTAIDNVVATSMAEAVEHEPTTTEVPEVYDTLRNLSQGGIGGSRALSDRSPTIMAYGMEPEYPFPDVVVPSMNPIDDRAIPQVALNEAILDESYTAETIESVEDAVEVIALTKGATPTPAIVNKPAATDNVAVTSTAEAVEPEPSGTEVPEVYDTLRNLSQGGINGSRVPSDGPPPIMAYGMEPEYPFPDVVGPSINPVDDRAIPRVALNEAVLDESYMSEIEDAVEVDTFMEGVLIETDTGELHEALFREDVADASLAYVEPDVADAANLAEPDSPDTVDFLHEPMEDTLSLISTLSEEDSPYDILSRLYAEDDAEASLAYIEPDMADDAGLTEPDTPDTVDFIHEPTENAGKPNLRSTPEAVNGETVPGDLHEALFREYVAETSFIYVEPSSPDTIDLADSPIILNEDTAETLYLLPTLAATDSSITLEEADGSWLLEEEVLQDLYDTIARLESSEAPQDVMVELCPSGDERDMLKVYLLLTKKLAGDKYYLQIGVFNGKDALARKLACLNWAYPYALETAGTMRLPQYKLLVGPVNEGESNALLLRFRRGGFHDAFIRREG